MTWPGPTAEPVQVTARPQRSLRVKLIGLVILVAALALAVVDVVLPTVVRSALISTRDATMSAMLSGVRSGSVSGEYIALGHAGPLSSNIGLTLVLSNGKGVVEQGALDDQTGPVIGTKLSSGPETIQSNGISYRVQAAPIPFYGDIAYVVIWSPLHEIDETVDRLILTELLVTAGVLLLLGLISSLLIRRQLHPLEEMASAADSIAAGDLTRRVPEDGAGAEVDRLGRAFNGMLDGIGELLAERRAAEARLRQFVADASHELRTPVAAVRGYTDLYAAGALPETAAVDRAMQRMGFESRRMAALVDDLITLIRADTADAAARERVDLVDLLRGVVEDAAAIDGSRSWSLAGVGEPGQAVVLGDRLRLHQLFANLLANVRTHTPPGTAATVTITVKGGKVEVEVADDGPGVSAESLPLLFDRFYREDPSRSREFGGSGLGLAIVAAIAGAHGGNVMAGNAPAGGLVIVVTLPRP